MNASKRLVLACSSLFAVLAMAGCGGSSYAAPGCTVDTALAATSVTISGSAFSSNCIKVAAGTTVTFTNSDIITHAVTADGVPAAYDSGNLLPGQTYQHVYGAAGTSTYHCRIHIGMTGTVFVQ